MTISQGYSIAAGCQKGGKHGGYKPTALQTSKRYLTATDVAELLGVSRSTAYRIIKRLNSELEKAGKLTVAGKVSAKYFYENTYL